MGTRSGGNQVCNRSIRAVVLLRLKHGYARRKVGIVLRTSEVP